MFTVVRGPNGARPNPADFVDGRARSTFDGDLSCGELHASGPRFALQLSDTEYPDFILSAVTIAGELTVRHSSYSLSDARIEAVLTEDALIQWIRAWQVMCAGPDAPGSCAMGNMIFGGEPDVIVRTLLFPILRGADVQVDRAGNVISTDCGADCNAVSACLAFTTTPYNAEALEGE